LRPCRIVESLEERIRRDGPLEVVAAVRLAARLATLLERLHAEGLVHGRVGWAAVRLRDDEPELLDAAELRESEAFHSPERVSGGGASAADDVWAAAVTLYASLTGQVPFDAPSSTEISRRVESMRPPPLAVFDAGDDELDTLLNDALARDVELRPRGASELRRELLAWLERRDERGAEAMPPSEVLRARLVKPASASVPSGVRPPAAQVDLASLPPPPPGSDAPPTAAPSSAFATVLDEETTLPRDDRPTLPHADPTVVADSARRAAERVGPPVVRAPRLPSGRPAPLGRSVPPPPVVAAEASLEQPSSEVQELGAPAPVSARSGASVSPPVVRSRNDLLDEVASPADPGSTSAAEAVPAKGRISLRAFALTLGVLGALLTGVILLRSRPAEPPTPSSAPSGTELPTPVGSAGVAASAALVQGTASPTASSASVMPTASAHAATPAPVVDVGACMHDLFAEGSFARPVGKSLDFVCSQRDPRKGAPAVREVVVRASQGRVTDGMREWALLGWYELAAYAAIRGRCCPDAEPLELPVTPGSCPDLGEALRTISAVARPGAPEASFADASGGFDASLRCVLRSRQTKAFGKHKKLAGGEGTAFQKTFSRARESK
jgi:eukaryotic-like serine/threonine-protein kinase